MKQYLITNSSLHVGAAHGSGQQEAGTRSWAARSCAPAAARMFCSATMWLPEFRPLTRIGESSMSNDEEVLDWFRSTWASWRRS
jgi:hypothetical protein